MKNDFPHYLSRFLTQYLPGEKGYNSNTIEAYRYTFIILLEFLKTKGIKAEKVKIETITKEVIEEFLNDLEKTRNNTTVTRNARLAAIHSFFRYLQYEYPNYIDEYIKILNIPLKKAKTRQMSYLTVEEMTLLLKEVEIQTPKGYRDYMIILTMYETACRVTELINLRIIDFRLSKPYLVKVQGKGDKQRSIPVSEIYVEKLNRYLEISKLNLMAKTEHIFFNSSKNKLTRAGVSHILNKYVESAKNKHPELFTENVTPHTIRHTKAMHLLQDDVNLVYIRDILGHSSIQTTEVYARADSARLRDAIEKSYKDITSNEKPKWQNESILTWLKEFNKK